MALANFAGELLETFDDLALGTEADVRDDGLRAIREGLVSVVGRVVNPLVGGIRAELLPLIEALENPVSTTGGNTKTLSGSKSTVILHPSIVALQATMPIYARALTRYTATTTSQATLASLLIYMLWRGLVALSNRPFQPVSPPASPALKPAVSRVRRESSSISPPLLLHPEGSRSNFRRLDPHHRPLFKVPPQPRRMHGRCMICLFFCRDLWPRITLAREAVDEAFNGLKALTALLEAAQSNAFARGTQTKAELGAELEVLTADLPTLIALPVVLRAYVSSFQTVTSMLGIPDGEYRKGCLHGFSRAEECAGAVGQRVLDNLAVDDAQSGATEVVKNWLEVEVSTADD